MTIFQHVTRGSLVQGSGFLAIVAGSSGVYLTRWGMFGFVLTGIPLWCFGVVAAAGGVMYFLGPMVYGSASVAPAAGSQGKPERMLFLYLRPFELDARNVLQLLVGASAGVLVYLNLLDGLWIPVAFLPVILNISKEQSFRDALGPLGDFIAFGRPGERLQPVGASRLYLKDEWKQEITGYMARARLVSSGRAAAEAFAGKSDRSLRRCRRSGFSSISAFAGGAGKRSGPTGRSGAACAHAWARSCPSGSAMNGTWCSMPRGGLASSAKPAAPPSWCGSSSPVPAM